LEALSEFDGKQRKAVFALSEMLLRENQEDEKSSATLGGSDVPGIGTFPTIQVFCGVY
jgi:hypothetical protein